MQHGDVGLVVDDLELDPGRAGAGRLAEDVRCPVLVAAAGELLGERDVRQAPLQGQ